MFAAAVLALAIVGMIQALVSGSEMLDVSRKQTIAATIIQGQIDHIRLCDWSVIENLPSRASADVGASNQATNIAAGFVFGTRLPGVAKNFTCIREVEIVKVAQPPFLPNDKQLRITYTVSWKGSTGRSYSRSASTYVAKNGLNVSYQRS
jgi:hypothetical protein